MPFAEGGVRDEFLQFLPECLFAPQQAFEAHAGVVADADAQDDGDAGVVGEDVQCFKRLEVAVDFGVGGAGLFDEFVGAKGFVVFGAIDDFGDGAVDVLFAL